MLAVPSAAAARTSVDIAGQGPDGSIVITGDDADSQVRLTDTTLNGTNALRVTVANASTTTAACRPFGTLVICPTNNVTQVEAALAGGVDGFDASQQTRLPVVVDGGSGDDTLTGSQFNDGLTGQSGSDTLDGGAGLDQLTGDESFNTAVPTMLVQVALTVRGDDILFGGSGDDELRPGAGSDIVSGGTGRDFAVPLSGTVTLGDRLCNDGSASDAPVVQRANARVASAPEGTLECPVDASARDLIAGVESADATGNGGVAVDFTGSGADETLTGNRRGDRLEGGGGVDSLFGDFGGDTLLARDGVVDGQLRCSTDLRVDPISRAVIDQDDVVQPGCETVERGGAGLPGPIGGGTPSPIAGFPPPSPSQGNLPSSTKDGKGKGGGDPNLAPQVELPDKTAAITRSGTLVLRVRCVYRAKDCVGKLSLKAGEKFGSGRNQISKGASLGSASVKVPWGTSKKTVFKAPKKLRKALAAAKGKKTLKLKVRVVVKDGAAGKSGKSATAKRKIKLGLVAGKKKVVKPQR